MIPVLYEQNETDFTKYGIGVLIDAMECHVIEERNNLYELELQYPITGLHYSQILVDRIIKAIPAEDADPQLFKIYAITKPINGIVTVNCEHISYRLRHIPVQPYSATNAAAAMAGIKTNSLVNNPFAFWTDVTTQSSLNIKEPRSARAVLGGVEGSIIDQFGGEYEFDNYNVKLWKNRGEDNGVTLRYGKNITDINQEESLENTVTGILPYWKNDTTVVMGDITKINTSYSYDRIETTDITTELSSDEADYVPTKAEVTAAGAKVLNGRSYLGIPSNNIKVSFVALWQTEEYKHIAALEKVHLCDTVTVIYERLGISRKAKVIKTDFDVIKERYNEIEIGDFRGNLSSTIVTQQQQIAEQQAQLDEQAQAAKRTQSRIDQTDERITLEVATREENDRVLSGKIEITDNRVTTEVADRINGDTNAIAQIDVKINAITLKVQNGEKSSLLTLTAGNTVLASENITLSGMVTFTDLSTSGSTTINGDNITTGQIKAIGIWGCTITGGIINATTQIFVNKKNPNGTITTLILTDELDSINSDISSLYTKVDVASAAADSAYNAANTAQSTANSALSQVSALDASKMNTYEPYISSCQQTVVSTTATLTITNVDGGYGYIRHIPASSKRWKRDIKNISDKTLDPRKLYNLPVRQFVFNNDYLDQNDIRHGKTVIGLIAEEVAEVYPIAADYRQEEPEIVSNWNERFLIPAMLKLIQEQHEEIEILKKKMEAIKC